YLSGRSNVCIHGLEPPEQLTDDIYPSRIGSRNHQALLAVIRPASPTALIPRGVSLFSVACVWLLSGFASW
ncbi:hypothetical protein L249_0696, partial [Ophiocordyceps polyrhachis-furcata BCC 54312]